MANYTYAQLEGIWLQAAAGTKYATQEWAALMAAIAEAESGGDPASTNPNDSNGQGGTQTSWGLWQISDGTHNPPAANWNNPVINAQLAVNKLGSQGLGAWGTYTSGAYKAYISGSTTPDTSAVSDASLLAATSAATGSALSTGNASECAWGIGLPGGAAGASAILSTVGLGWLGASSGGQVCLISKSQVRGLAGVGLMVAGGLLMLSGTATIVVAAGAPVAARMIPQGRAVGALTGGLSGSLGGATARRSATRAARPAGVRSRSDTALTA